MNKLKGIIAVYDKNVFFHHVEHGQMGPATNLTMDSVKSIFRMSLKNKKDTFMKFKGLIPENVLSYDSFDGSIIFYTKPCYKKMIFSKNIDIPAAYYKMPYLLWRYKNKHLSVYALKRKPKDEHDQLYHAPFMNVNNFGGVCMGNVKYGNEKYIFDKLMEDIVEKFFNSVFTHTNHNKILKINYQEFLKTYANDKDMSYSRLLNPMKKEIIDIL